MKTQRQIDEMKAEHMRRMAEAEPLASLRRQLEQIKSEERQAAQDCINAIAVGDLREQIKRRGRKPCA